MGIFNQIEKTAPSPALVLGICAFVLSAMLLILSPVMAIIPLGIFIAACLTAPFLPRSRFFLPVISKGSSGKQAVAITFDDGPDPQTTPLLLQLLADHNVKATFFVAGANARKYPHIVRDILSSGHSIGNHTFTHDVLIMLKSKKKLEQEIISAQRVLKEFGILPYAFRPPAGIVNPKLGPVLKQQQMFCVNYSRRGVDAGNRRTNNLSEKILSKSQSDDIILLHDVSPPHASHVREWLREVEHLLVGLQKKGLDVLPLSEIIGRPVMGSVPNL